MPSQTVRPLQGTDASLGNGELESLQYCPQELPLSTSSAGFLWAVRAMVHCSVWNVAQNHLISSLRAIADLASHEKKEKKGEFKRFMQGSCFKCLAETEGSLCG